MGKSQRDKGKRGEYIARDWLKHIWPSAKRGANQSRAGNEAADVEGTPFWVEVKIGARPNIMAAMRQAQEATDGRPCLVMSKRDREGMLVTMTVEDWLWLARKAEG